MTNKPLLQEIEDTLEDASGYVDPEDNRIDIVLARLREFKAGVDVEALDEARERYINHSGYELSGRDSMLFFKAATKLREILGE